MQEEKKEAVSLTDIKAEPLATPAQSSDESKSQVSQAQTRIEFAQPLQIQPQVSVDVELNEEGLNEHHGKDVEMTDE